MLNLFGLLCSLLVERYSASSSQRPYPPYIRTIIGGLSYRLVPADSPNIHHHLPLSTLSPPLLWALKYYFPFLFLFLFLFFIYPFIASPLFLYIFIRHTYLLACRFLSSPLLLLSLLFLLLSSSLPLQSSSFSHRRLSYDLWVRGRIRYKPNTCQNPFSSSNTTRTSSPNYSHPLLSLSPLLAILNITLKPPTLWSQSLRSLPSPPIDRDWDVTLEPSPPHFRITCFFFHTPKITDRETYTYIQPPPFPPLSE